MTVRVHLPTLTADRVAMPQFLIGLAAESLADLSWTDPSLGVQEYAWWPEENGDEVRPDWHRWGDEILTPDPARQVVIVTHQAVPMTVEEIQAVREARKRECDLVAKGKRDAVVAAISSAEMASWPIKRAEALAYQAAGQSATDADAPNLATEAEARGVTTAVLVGKVLAKAAFLADLEARIAGVNGKHNDAIDAAETEADLVAVDINSGWPI